MKRYPFLYLSTGTITALLIALLIVVIGLRPSKEDLQLLILFMLVSGIGTMGFVYVVYQHLLMTWVNSLRWSLITAVMTTVLLVFLNVWGTAQLMFINEHDLILTVALLVFGGLTAVVFGWYIAGRIAQKIENISNGIERLTHGDMSIRLQPEGNDELSKLAAMFNLMIDNFEEIERQKQTVDQTRRDLVAWISHDLRTPLTTMQASLEAIADDIVTEPHMIKEYVNNSLTEVENLKVFIGDLFDVSKLDTGHIHLQLTIASLHDLISDIVSSMRVRAAKRDITINGEIAPDIDPVNMAPDKIQRVLYNLIDNAIRHTPNGGCITIRANRQPGRIQVDVQNSGSQIAPEHLPFIFEKFYRGEQARTRDSDGHRGAGLGLAIARGFVEAHSGKIWVENLTPKSTCFSFTLPSR